MALYRDYNNSGYGVDHDYILTKKATANGNDNCQHRRGNTILHTPQGVTGVRRKLRRLPLQSATATRTKKTPSPVRNDVFFI